MIGIIDVGRNVSGVYGAGVLDYAMDHGIRFDYGIGDSAGGSNLVSFFAGQNGRSFEFYNDYAFRYEYLNIGKLITEKNLTDLDLIYGEMSNEFGAYPLDHEKAMRQGIPLKFVATNAETGETRYFGLDEMTTNDYRILKATSSLPVANEPVMIDGIPYYDGALTDPLPVKKALEDGCDRIVLILGRQLSYRRDHHIDEILHKMLERKYPVLSEKILNLSEKYNGSLEYAMKLEEEGKLVIVAPDRVAPIRTLIKDREMIKKLYLKGYRDGRMISEFVSR